MAAKPSLARQAKTMIDEVMRTIRRYGRSGTGT